MSTFEGDNYESKMDLELNVKDNCSKGDEKTSALELKVFQLKKRCGHLQAFLKGKNAQIDNLKKELDHTKAKQAEEVDTLKNEILELKAKLSKKEGVPTEGIEQQVEQWNRTYLPHMMELINLI